MTDTKLPSKPVSDALDKVGDKIAKLWQGVLDALETLVSPAPQPVPIPIRGGRRGR
ncbi:MAG: hypothetical protein KF729_11440 [Sandaracinaceae bacterium]|nr:hypothetical protein [Sandaracinaceae bacterium]